LHAFDLWARQPWTYLSANRQDAACSSPTFCEAVGGYANAEAQQVGFADIWNGTSWRVQTVPSPSGSYPFEGLNGVSCTSPTFCQAVGAGSTNYADIWNGTSWTLADLPTAAGRSVSCLSATFCEAVGGSDAAMWNGTTWTTQPVSGPAGAEGVNLSAVSCATATSCEAAGSYDNSTGTQLLVAEAWQGTSWTSQSPPSPAGAASPELSGISCPATTACTSVGSYSNGKQEGLADGWNGTSWKAQRVAQPAGPTSNGFTAVSCVSSSWCEAVGSRDNLANTTLSLAEGWNGTSWTVQPSAVPAGGAASDLFGVSCVSSDFCEAVGGGASPAEIWNGTSWSAQTIPGSSTYYAAVSCTSADFCVAVGGAAQIAVWNGTSWSAQAGATGFTGLTSVSCASAADCEAVGYGPSGENAEGWNGVSWSAQATPTPVGGYPPGGLDSVSCAAADYCAAVGDYQLQSTGQNNPVAEVWDGTSWRVQHTPVLKKAYDSGLKAVWCSTPGSCTAVGSYGPIGSVSEFTLAMVWNGTSWLNQSTPRPAKAAGDTVLNGVTCAQPGDCIAGGSYPDASGISQTLVERGD
jgi:hypothetical protein